MRMVRPVGLAVGVLGNVFIGVAIFHLLQQGSCGDFGQPTCSAGTGWYVALLPVGIIASMLGIFLGGGGVMFGTTFLAVGLGAMAAAGLGDNSEMRVFGWVFGGAFAFVGVLAVLGRFALGRSLAVQQADTAQLVATGAPATATVTNVQDTGITINDNPQVVLTVRIEPTDGRPPYDSTMSRTVSRVAIPRVGDRMAVRYDTANPQHWVETGSAAADPMASSFSAPGPAPVPGAAAVLDDLDKLHDLKLSGALTDEEFETAKARLLGRLGQGPSGA